MLMVCVNGAAFISAPVFELPGKNWYNTTPRECRWRDSELHQSKNHSKNSELKCSQSKCTSVHGWFFSYRQGDLSRRWRWLHFSSSWCFHNRLFYWNTENGNTSCPFPSGSLSVVFHFSGVFNQTHLPGVSRRRTRGHVSLRHRRVDSKSWCCRNDLVPHVVKWQLKLLPVRPPSDSAVSALAGLTMNNPECEKPNTSRM